MKITEQVESFARPVVESLGLRLWDVEYVREGADWFLRVYIDKDGNVDIYLRLFGDLGLDETVLIRHDETQRPV